MFEKRVIPSGMFGKCEFLDLKKYVVVNDFAQKSSNTFREECEKVLNTGQDFLPIVIDSYGGDVYALLGMIDFIDTCGVKIVTICESKCMSAGALLFSCGQERYMAPHCTVMVHEVASFMWGKDTELQNSAKEVSRLNKKLYAMLDKNTEQKSGYWKELTKNNKYADLFMTAQTSRKHNLATVMGVPHLETSVNVDTKLVV